VGHANAFSKLCKNVPQYFVLKFQNCQSRSCDKPKNV